MDEWQQDEVDAALQDWDGNPFFKDNKLYGQDYEQIKAGLHN